MAEMDIQYISTARLRRFTGGDARLRQHDSVSWAGSDHAQGSTAA